MEPDSALYLSIGRKRNLAEGHGYTFRDKPDRLAYPGLPYVHAALFKIFGSNTLVPAHVLMLLTAESARLLFTVFDFSFFTARAVMRVMGAVGSSAITYTFFRYGYELRNGHAILLGVTGFLVGYEAILANFSSGRDGRTILSPQQKRNGSIGFFSSPVSRSRC